MKTCAVCEKEMQDKDLICPFCGQQYEAEAFIEETPIEPVEEKQITSPTLIYCWECGQLVSIHATKCPHCGGYTTEFQYQWDKNRNEANVFAQILKGFAILCLVLFIILFVITYVIGV